MAEGRESRNRNTNINHSLGDGIKVIMHVTPGELTPPALVHFLEIVSEKEAKECARRFTDDIKALVQQLKDVVKNYNYIRFKSDKIREDIDHILLVLKWLEENGSQGDVGSENDKVNEVIERDADQNSSISALTSSSGESPIQNRNPILGDDIKRIIHDNPGVVPPTNLITFLEICKHVNKKRVENYARYFAEDTNDLVKQLKDVIEIYKDKYEKSTTRKEVIKYIFQIANQLAKVDTSNENKVHNKEVANLHSSFNASLSSREGSPYHHRLSADIKSIIEKTPGVLGPTVLIFFLENLNKEEDAEEYATEFTDDIEALVKQLKEVQKNYKKKRIEDVIEGDINYIHHISERLEASTSNREGSPYHHRLSADIKSIIKETPGVLGPTVLIFFLENVNREEDANEYATEFTDDIEALVKQLKEIQKNYNKNRIDDVIKEDIKFIHRISEQLEASTSSNKKTSATSVSWDDIDSIFDGGFSLLHNYSTPTNYPMRYSHNLNLLSSEDERRENNHKREEEERSRRFCVENILFH